MARSYPPSTLVGYDIAADAIERACKEAVARALRNASFETLDVTLFEADPPFLAVFAFDAVHDQVDPAGVLDRVRAAWRATGCSYVRHPIETIMASSNDAAACCRRVARTNHDRCVRGG